jgi:CTP:molybdopterin cytidylyltransferase MocA
MLAVLLAAGAGRRLGGPKALLELAGRTALERCVHALREGGAEELRVVLGARAEEVLARHARLDVHFVVNTRWEEGQTSSLQAGLAAAPITAELFALHTVDHPLLQAEQVALLRAAYRDRPAGRRIVLPSVGGRRGHPALFEASLAEEFLALGPGEPAHSIVRRDPVRVHHVELDAAWLVRDLDTPDDLRDILAALD